MEWTWHWPEMPPKLTIGCVFSDRIEALLDGRVAIPGYEIDLHVVEPQRLFRSVLRDAAWDVAELSMASHIAAVAAGRTGYVGLPVFLSRSFRHSNLYVRTDRIRRPEELAGGRIGLVDFQQTAALWLRGILSDNHGVERRSVEWIAAGLHAPVLDDRAPGPLPQGFSIRRSPETLDALLREGRIDAVISPTAPRCAGEPDVPVARMWSDPAAVELDWWRRTGIFPIMHVAVVRRALAERDPALPDALSEAFETARRHAAADLANRDFPKIALPWIATHVADVRQTLGGDPWTYGFDANGATIAAMLRYAVADGLAPPDLVAGALFA